jgi:hypothetical protein
VQLNQVRRSERPKIQLTNRSPWSHGWGPRPHIPDRTSCAFGPPDLCSTIPWSYALAQAETLLYCKQ